METKFASWSLPPWCLSCPILIGFWIQCPLAKFHQNCRVGVFESSKSWRKTDFDLDNYFISQALKSSSAYAFKQFSKQRLWSLLGRKGGFWKAKRVWCSAHLFSLCQCSSNHRAIVWKLECSLPAAHLVRLPTTWKQSQHLKKIPYPTNSAMIFQE